jgi:hypothetical protein
VSALGAGRRLQPQRHRGRYGTIAHGCKRADAWCCRTDSPCADVASFAATRRLAGGWVTRCDGKFIAQTGVIKVGKSLHCPGIRHRNVERVFCVECDMRVRIQVLVVASMIGAVALGAAPAIVARMPATFLAGCGAGYYEDSDGQCIRDPSSGGLPPGGAPGLVGSSGPPAGATAICRDGDYSYSTHHTGTCSGHGGVSEWLTN